MSSILSRLSSRFRQDTSYISPPDWYTSGSGKNKPPTFVPYLIQHEVDDVDDPHHLNDVSRRDPVAYFGTYGVANEAMGDGFVLVDASGEEAARNKRVQRELMLLKATDVMIQALAYERAFGTGYIYTGKNRYVPETPEGGRLAALAAFSPLTCTVKRYNDTGRPIVMELTVQVGEGEYSVREKKISLPAEDFIFLVTRPRENNPYQGQSALEPVWDDLTYLRYIMHSMSWYDMKIGNGMFYVITKTGIPDTMVARLNTSLEDHSIKRATVFDGQHVQEFGFAGPNAGATDFPSHIDACLQRISAGLDIPKDVLVGVTGGTNEAASSAEKASFKKVSEVRIDCEYAWRELITRAGFSIDDLHFQWNERFAHDEEQRSKIEMNTAQANNMKMAYMTIDEIREHMGLAPLPDGRGDKLQGEVSSFNMNVQGLGGPEAPPSEQAEDTKNPAGVQV